ncbi:MAG TPA: hypothetical protein VG097_19285 [Gemmata sp.]|jgi:hypothetical protein|nr:hypothetical protein [Gemmata sp.]
MSIALGYTLIMTLLFAVSFVPLALTEKKTLVVRSLYVLVAMLFTLSLGFLFTNFERQGENRGPSGMVKFGDGFAATIDAEKAMHLAARGFGLWLVVLAGGELLRLILKRPVGHELLGSAVLFLAGASLIEPHWAIGLAIAVGLASIAIVSLWGQKQEEAAPVGVHTAPASPTSHPTSSG